MTWAIFAVGWINAGDFNRSAPHFQRGYANVHPPFNVWTESPSGGTVNFITVSLARHIRILVCTLVYVFAGAESTRICAAQVLRA